MTMNAYRVLGVVCAACLLFGLSGCNTERDRTDWSPRPANAAAAADVADADDIDLPQGNERVRLDPKEFTTKIDNKYWPMQPGRRWTYREIDEEGNRLEVVVTVTNQTKKIANGVTARVVRDTVTEDCHVVEDTFDWYAQDAEGNIWYLGENTAEFENGKLTTKEGSWEAGVDGAKAGIAVTGKPKDDQAYRQEFAEGVAEDNGEVLSTEEQIDVKTGHYENVLLTKDTNALEPRVLEYKFYAPHVGPVLALGISGGADREELVKFDKVSDKEAKQAATKPLGTKVH